METDDPHSIESQEPQIYASGRTLRDFPLSVEILRKTGFKGSIVLLNPQDAVFSEKSPVRFGHGAFMDMVEQAVPASSALQRPIKTVLDMLMPSEQDHLQKSGAVGREFADLYSDFAGISNWNMGKVVDFPDRNVIIISVGDKRNNGNKFSQLSVLGHEVNNPISYEEYHAFAMLHELQHGIDNIEERRLGHHSPKEKRLQILSEASADCGGYQLLERIGNDALQGRVSTIIKHQDNVRAFDALQHNEFQVFNGPAAHATAILHEDGPEMCSIEDRNDSRGRVMQIAHQNLHKAIDYELGRAFASQAIGPETIGGADSVLPADVYMAISDFTSTVRTPSTLRNKILGGDEEALISLGQSLRACEHGPVLIDGAVRVIDGRADLGVIEQRYINQYKASVEALVPTLAKDPLSIMVQERVFAQKNDRNISFAINASDVTAEPSINEDIVKRPSTKYDFLPKPDSGM